MQSVATTLASSDAAQQLATDVELLEKAERQGLVAFRTWSLTSYAVIVGVAVDINEEVDRRVCEDMGIPIVRRRSGGHSVVIGPGTVQYTFALPRSLSPELASIGGAKAFCNRLLRGALTAVRPEIRLDEDPSGDLTVADRKVAGLALKRRRNAVLVHGTILADADIDLIDTVLKEPRRQPSYRRGRAHRDFLANFGPLDSTQLDAHVKEALARDNAHTNR